MPDLCDWSPYLELKSQTIETIFLRTLTWNSLRSWTWSDPMTVVGLDILLLWSLIVSYQLNS